MLGIRQNGIPSTLSLMLIQIAMFTKQDFAKYMSDRKVTDIKLRCWVLMLVREKLINSKDIDWNSFK